MAIESHTQVTDLDDLMELLNPATYSHRGFTAALHALMSEDGRLALEGYARPADGIRCPGGVFFDDEDCDIHHAFRAAVDGYIEHCELRDAARAAESRSDTATPFESSEFIKVDEIDLGVYKNAVYESETHIINVDEYNDDGRIRARATSKEGCFDVVGHVSEEKPHVYITASAKLELGVEDIPTSNLIKDVEATGRVRDFVYGLLEGKEA